MLISTKISRKRRRNPKRKLKRRKMMKLRRFQRKIKRYDAKSLKVTKMKIVVRKGIPKVRKLKSQRRRERK